jgi:hypothetical protein
MKIRVKKYLVQSALGSALACVSLVPSRASAQQRDPAAAQALFDQARDLIQQHRYAEACPKLLESNRLDPGIGTQFHLANCYEQSGKIATAWATFLDVASQARAANQLDREKAARKRAAQLEARLPKLVIDVPDARRVPGLEIKRDGIVVSQAQWGTAVPVDPGEHQLSVSAPGRHGVNQILKAEEGKPILFDTPELEAGDEATEPAPTREPETKPVESPAPTTHKRHHKHPPADTSEPPPTPKSRVDAWPLALAGVGLAGLAVGTIFVLEAASNNTKSKSDCDAMNMNLCGPAGVSQRNTALTDGNVATAAIVGGAAFLAAAGLVWDLEYHNKSASAPLGFRAAAALTPGNAALYLKGDF